MRPLFTERHGDAKPRIAEVLNEPTVRGILSLISARVEEHWFGLDFPMACEDGQTNAGVDKSKLQAKMSTYRLIWPDDWSANSGIPEDGQVFDLIEFSYEFIARPQSYEEHSWHRHYHYRYDRDAGRLEFQTEINRIFEFNGIAFELSQGEVSRTAPTGIQEALAATIFKTGDGILDELLEDARRKFLNRDFKVRKESLEKLWDAWERLKTIGVGSNKREQAQALISAAARDQTLQELIEKEARELTDIGNRFMIRHSEVNKVPITESGLVDYLFHRLFSLIRFLLHGNGLGG